MYISPRISVSDITVLPHLVNEHSVPHEICSLVYYPEWKTRIFPLFLESEIEV
jgi:hypothetical protein